MTETTCTTRPDDLDSAIWTRAPVFLNCLARRTGGRSGNSGYPGLTPMEKDALAVVWTFCRRDRGQGLFYMSEEALGDHLGMAGENRRQSAGRLLKSLVGKGLLVRGAKAGSGQFSYTVNVEGVLSMLLRLGWRLEPVGENLHHIYDPEGAERILGIMSAQPMLGALAAMRLYANMALQPGGPQDEHRDALPDEHHDAPAPEHSGTLPDEYSDTLPGECPNTHEPEYPDARDSNINGNTDSIRRKEPGKRSTPPTPDEVRPFFTENAIPTIEEVERYVEAEGLAVDPREFYEICERRGWKNPDGRPINSWKGYLRGWARNGGRAYGSASKATAADDSSPYHHTKIPEHPSVEFVMEYYHAPTPEFAQKMIDEGIV